VVQSALGVSRSCIVTALYDCVWSKHHFVVEGFRGWSVSLGEIPTRTAWAISDSIGPD
jgi:hypothetical protein